MGWLDTLRERFFGRAQRIVHVEVAGVRSLREIKRGF